MDDATTRAAMSDADLLAGLRGRRQTWQGLLALMWTGLGAVQLLTSDETSLGITWLVVGVVGGWLWWISPQPHVRAVTADELVLRRGLVRSRSIARTEIADVTDEHAGAYGLRVTLHDGEEIVLLDTARQYDNAAAQAAALRRWAGVS